MHKFSFAYVADPVGYGPGSSIERDNGLNYSTPVISDAMRLESVLLWFAVAVAVVGELAEVAVLCYEHAREKREAREISTEE